MASSSTLWQDVDDDRTFLVPDAFVFDPGNLSVTNRLGRIERVDPECIKAFELSRDQAQRWAKVELGQVLEELREGIDARLSEARQQLADWKRSETAYDTAPALLDLLKSLPGVIGQSLSGDEQRIDTARETMTRLQQRLKDSGIDVDDRMKNFADRLASIRTDAETAKSSEEAANEDKITPDDKR